MARGFAPASSRARTTYAHDRGRGRRKRESEREGTIVVRTSPHLRVSIRAGDVERGAQIVVEDVRIRALSEHLEDGLSHTNRGGIRRT